MRLKPYAPALISAVRNGGTVDLIWNRRDRRGGESQIFDIKPLSEDLERYFVQVWSAGILERAVTVDKDEFASLASVPSPATIKIFQVSAKVGNGYSVEVTL
jgi:hypothetical protein